MEQHLQASSRFLRRVLEVTGGLGEGEPLPETVALRPLIEAALDGTCAKIQGKLDGMAPLLEALADVQMAPEVDREQVADGEGVAKQAVRSKCSFNSSSPSRHS